MSDLRQRMNQQVGMTEFFELVQKNTERGLGRAQMLELIAQGLTEQHPDIARALDALAQDMIDDRMLVLSWVEQLLEASRANRVTGYIDI